MRDIICGAIDGYDWDKVRVWAKSIRASGFDGDVALIVYRTTPKVIEECKKLNIELYQVEHDDLGHDINHSTSPNGTHCHALRFFHIWQLLKDLGNKHYRYVIITDVRDVVFQKNPSPWLEEKFESFTFRSDLPFETQIIAPSEGLLIADESWNQNNIINGFGYPIYDSIKNNPVVNIGTIAGTFAYMVPFCLLLFEMTKNRYIPSDQSSFNVMTHQLLLPHIRIIDMDEGWCAQCATTHEPSRSHVWDKLIDPRPIIKDGKFYTLDGEEFAMAHQYDRVPEVNQMVEKLYETN